MALKTIETKAIIAAEDKTGATFAQVAQKLKQMEDRADGANKKLAATAKAAKTAREAAPKAERAGAGAVPSVPAMVTAFIAAESIRALAEAIGERIHESVSMKTGGMSDAQIKEAKVITASLAAKYPTLTQTELMHMYRTGRAITGTTEEAAFALEQMAPLAVISKYAGGRKKTQEESEQEMDVLLKGMEIKGVTQNQEQFKAYIEGISKALNAFPSSTMRPHAYYEMMKFGRQAVPGISDKFILGVAPTFGQEMGGMSFGQSMAAFNRAIVGGHMEHPALKRLAALGLVDKDDLNYMGTGEIKGLKEGRHIQGFRTAETDPYEWVKKYMMPAFEKHGITKKEDQLAEISEMFSKGTAAQFVSEMLTQQKKIDKDMELISKAMGTEAAKTIRQGDVGVQLEGLNNALSNTATTFATNIIGNTDAINKLTDAISGINVRMTETAPGYANRRLDQIFGLGPRNVNASKEERQRASLDLYNAQQAEKAARERRDESSWWHPLERLGRDKELGEAMEKEMRARQDLEAMRPSLISPDLMRSGIIYPRRGVPAGVLSPNSPFGELVTRLEGAANIGVRVDVGFDPGLIAKQVTQTLNASGNLRGDTGVSMPQPQP